MRRAAGLFAALLIVYAATIGLDAFGPAEYAGDEPHYLLTAQSLVEDGDVDVLDDYRDREYASFYPFPLEPHGSLTEGRLHEPHGIGLPLLIAPALALGGPRGAELLMAVLAALAVTLAYALALRAVPDPWALGATLAVGLSPPFLAYASAVYPELAAGAALAGAALLALRLRERPSRPATFLCFGLLATLPWLGTKFVPAGVVIGLAAGAWLWQHHHRRLLAVAGGEVVGFSAALWVGVNQGLYGGFTPYAAADSEATTADALDYAGRAYRAMALMIDREYGLLRWAPVFALGLLGAWLVYRTRRHRLGAGIATLAGAQRAACLCALALAAQGLVAVFLAPTMFGFWFPPRHLMAALPLAVPLVAWGLRRAPRAGTALGLVGVAASVWLYLDVRLGEGGLVVGRPDAPWGPLEAAFPLFQPGAVVPFVVAGMVGVGLIALLIADERHWRQTAGPTRLEYSP